VAGARPEPPGDPSAGWAAEGLAAAVSLTRSCDAPDCEKPRPSFWLQVDVKPPRDGHHLLLTPVPGARALMHYDPPLLGGSERWHRASGPITFDACSHECMVAALKALPRRSMICQFRGFHVRPAVFAGLLAVPEATQVEDAAA
jgi:hypothetical protein